jgi:hypothetical protein
MRSSPVGAVLIVTSCEETACVRSAGVATTAGADVAWDAGVKAWAHKAHKDAIVISMSVFILFSFLGCKGLHVSDAS